MRDLLDKTLTLKRGNGGKDAVGGNKPTFTTVASGVACTVAPASVRTVQTYQGDSMVVDSEVITADDIAARRQDLVVIGTDVYTVVGYKKFDNSSFGDPVCVAAVSRKDPQ